MRFILAAFAAFAHGPAIQVLFFITTDCPVSNFYAPEIQSICRDYRDVSCRLVYEDLAIDKIAVRRHMSEYKYGDLPNVIDSHRDIAVRVGATVTPEAVVIDMRAAVRYRGRIDNFYAAIGRPRRQATEHDVRRALDAVLAGKPVANPQTTPIGCSIVPPNLLEGK
jgi:thiol-disulfide isomerase/thioredoxin